MNCFLGEVRDIWLDDIFQFLVGVSRLFQCNANVNNSQRTTFTNLWKPFVKGFVSKPKCFTVYCCYNLTKYQQSRTFIFEFLKDIINKRAAPRCRSCPV